MRLPKNKYVLIVFLFLTQLFLKNCTKTNVVEKAEIKTPESGLISSEKDSEKINLDSFAIFSLHAIEDKGIYRTFISLSDIYRDSVTVPPEMIANQNNIPFDILKRIELSDLYRKKLLKGTGFKESDTLYIFNYQSNTLEKLPLNTLKAVAHLNGYTSEGEEIADHYYQVGFELNTLRTSDKEPDPTNYSFAYIGTENPFSEQPLKQIKWKKISATEFPNNDVKRKSDLKTKGVYQYTDGNLIYYLQDQKSDDYLEERTLIVLNEKRKIIYKNTFDNSDEGSALTHLNGIENQEYTDYQWTGKLFKNKPPVIFDLVNSSFGCPEIIFLDQSYPRFFINCDNRH